MSEWQHRCVVRLSSVWGFLFTFHLPRSQILLCRVWKLPLCMCLGRSTTLCSVKACMSFMCSMQCLDLLLDAVFRRKSLGTVHVWPVAPAGDSPKELCCWHQGEWCKTALALMSHALLTVELCSQDSFQNKAWQGQNLTRSECSLGYWPPATLGRALQWIVRGCASELCKCYVTHTLEKETLSIHSFMP